MCLIPNNKVKIPYSRSKEYFIGYKLLIKGFNAPLTPYVYQQGWNEPDFPDNTKERLHSYERGFLHVFLTKKAAELFRCNKQQIVVPVRCHYEDVAAIGFMDDSDEFPQVAMRKLFITKVNYNKAAKYLLP